MALGGPPARVCQVADVARWAENVLELASDVIA